jgi:hypothetical protein
VIVALSTLIAVVTVSAVISQIGPFDRAGALLPEGPIVVSGDPADSSPAGTSADDEPSTPTDSPQSSTGTDPVVVVAPAPAETVATEPEPSTAPESGGPPTSKPGNSGNAPGQTGDPGNSGNAPGNNKP